MLNISFPSLQRDAQDVLQDMFKMSVPITRGVFLKRRFVSQNLFQIADKEVETPAFSERVW